MRVASISFMLVSLATAMCSPASSDAPGDVITGAQDDAGGATHGVAAPGASGTAPPACHAEACLPSIRGGFGASPSARALPAPRCQVKFDALGGGGSGALRWQLFDLTGDAIGDIVVTSDACDADVGRKRWDVYPATAAGFASTPRPFAIPASRCKTNFSSASGGGDVTFALVELTCDRIPELVVFRDACDPEVGSRRWDVYAGGAQGFESAPTSLSIPPPRCQVRFDAPSHVGALTYGLFDATGDALPDLVVTSDACDGAVGVSRWDIYSLR